MPPRFRLIDFLKGFVPGLEDRPQLLECSHQTASCNISPLGLPDLAQAMKGDPPGTYSVNPGFLNQPALKVG